MEEKIVICPYCGAAVPKNWRFCPKCAHLLTEEPAITVIAPPPVENPDLEQNLRNAVEVSYLDESDLEPPAADSVASSGAPEEVNAVSGEPSPSEEPEPIVETTTLFDETDGEPLPHDDQSSLSEPSGEKPAPKAETSSKEPTSDEKAPRRKKWRAATSAFPVERLFGKKTASDSDGTPEQNAGSDSLDQAAVPLSKGKGTAALLKKIFLLSPEAPSPSHSFQDKTAPLAVILPEIDAAEKGNSRSEKHRTKIVPPPVYLAVERSKNRRIVALLLVAVLALGCGAPFFFRLADTKALEASLFLGWSREEVNERTPYTLALRFEDGMVETYQSSAFYRTEYVLSRKPYTVTSPETVEIDGKEYKIQLSEDKTTLTMRPAFSFYGAKEVWYLSEK